MTKREPIKRHEALKGLSRDHHQGLLLSFKIRQGLKLNVSVDRIKKYCDWFWLKHLVPHFQEEEKLVFPVLGYSNELVKRALTEHKELENLFLSKNNTEEHLIKIGSELESHIRFEERILFNKIQETASKEELIIISSHHEAGIASDIWEDEFWVESK